MEIELIRNQNRNYACIRLQEEHVHAHERSMLNYNRVSCLLPVNIRYVDELLHVEYDFSGMQSLAELFIHQRLTQEQIIWLVRTLREAQDVLLEYMLSPDGLILEPDYVFVDASDMRISFCYQPGERDHVEKNVHSLLRYILDHVDYTNQRAVELAYALYNLEEDTGNILCTLDAFAGKTRLREQEAPAADNAPRKAAGYQDEGMDKRKIRQGFFDRLFRKKGSRELLLEHAATIENQEEGEAFGTSQRSAGDAAGKRFIQSPDYN